jgi:hypothetical protein
VWAGGWLALTLTFCTSLAGVLIGWSWDKAGMLSGLAMLLPYFLLDHILISIFWITIPFIIPVSAWGGGIMVGETLRITNSHLIALRVRSSTTK